VEEVGGGVDDLHRPIVTNPIHVAELQEAQLFDFRRPFSRLSARSIGVPAVLFAAMALAGCFRGSSATDSTTTRGTLSTVAVSIANPANTLTDAAVEAVIPTGSDAVAEPADDSGTCSASLDVRPLVVTATETDPIEWSGDGQSSGLGYGGWLTEAEIAAVEAEGITVDRAQFNLSCVGGGGRAISLVGTNLIPMRAADYQLRLSPTGGQSVRDTLLLNVSTVSTDVTNPRTSVWALAEATTLRILEFDEAHIRAEIEAEIVSVETGRAATLTADFDFRRG
jgi:hypothetical protein